MLFMAIDAVKFRKAVTPGDQLHIEVVPLRKGKIFKMKGEIKVDGQVVSSAEFLAGLAEKIQGRREVRIATRSSLLALALARHCVWQEEPRRSALATPRRSRS